MSSPFGRFSNAGRPDKLVSSPIGTSVGIASCRPNVKSDQITRSIILVFCESVEGAGRVSGSMLSDRSLDSMAKLLRCINFGEFKTSAFIHPTCGKILYSSSASSLTQNLSSDSNPPSGWSDSKFLDVDGS